MAQPLDALVSATSPKQFVEQFKEIEKSYTDIEAFLSDLVDQVAPRLYDPVYDEVPRGFYGITCASLAEQALPMGRRWRPYAQQVSALTRERKRIHHGDLGREPEKSQGGEGALRQDLRPAMQQQDFAAVMRISKQLLAASPNRLRQELMILALEDAALGGHKFNYLCQSWLLAERRGFVDAHKVLFGPLHLLTFAARDESLTGLTSRAESSLSEGEGVLDAATRSEIEKTVLFASAAEAMDRVRHVMRGKVRREETRDLLRLTAARAIANAQRGQWLAPVRAFHTVFLVTEHLDWFSEQDRPRALLLAALFVQRASSRTREGPTNRPLDEVAQAFCPTDPFGVLRSVISHSDPSPRLPRPTQYLVWATRRSRSCSRH
jgi:hypothetical protein